MLLFLTAYARLSSLYPSSDSGYHVKIFQILVVYVVSLERHGCLEAVTHLSEATVKHALTWHTPLLKQHVYNEPWKVRPTCIANTLPVRD